MPERSAADGSAVQDRVGALPGHGPAKGSHQAGAREPGEQGSQEARSCVQANSLCPAPAQVLTKVLDERLVAAGRGCQEDADRAVKSPSQPPHLQKRQARASTDQDGPKPFLTRPLALALSLLRPAPALGSKVHTGRGRKPKTIACRAQVGQGRQAPAHVTGFRVRPCHRQLCAQPLGGQRGCRPRNADRQHRTRLCSRR